MWMWWVMRPIGSALRPCSPVLSLRNVAYSSRVSVEQFLLLMELHLSPAISAAVDRAACRP
jgi:hypothetical protein